MVHLSPRAALLAEILDDRGSLDVGCSDFLPHPHSASPIHEAPHPNRPQTLELKDLFSAFWNLSFRN
eukprot:5336862-Amphidinium_carterae.2